MNFFAKLKFSPKFRERHEKTYIMPTLYGVSFAVICLVLFSIAFVSTNNAVYFLCFLMVALGSQSLLLTNRTTENLKVMHLRADDFFAEEAGAILLQIHNPTAQDLQSLEFRFSKVFQSAGIVVERLGAGEHREIRLPFISALPGVFKVPEIRISSDFPYHFSRSWKKHISNLNLYVYPARKGTAQFAKAAFAQRGLELQSLEEFKDHREYRKTDSPRSIDWKVSARMRKIMSKEYEPEDSRKITLRWNDCPQAEAQAKKSQLSLWIDLAEKNNYDYALELPNRTFPFAKGPQHKSQCLRALI